MSLTDDVVVLSAVCVCFVGPLREITCLRGFANSKGADKPAHPRGLISTFVISLMECSNLDLLQAEFLISICRKPKDRFSCASALFLVMLTIYCVFTSTVSLPKSGQQPT